MKMNKLRGMAQEDIISKIDEMNIYIFEPGTAHIASQEVYLLKSFDH